MQNANRLYNLRHRGTPFPTVGALVDHARLERELSAEVRYNWKDLHFTADAGNVQLVSPRGAADLNHWSFAQGCSMLKSPAEFMRDGLTPELAAECLNYRISQTPTAQDAHILARRPNGTPNPTIRAINGKAYARLWDDEYYASAEEMIFSRQNSNGHSWKNAPTWEGEEIAGSITDRDSWVLRIDGGSIVTDPSVSGNQDGSMFRAILMGNSEVGAGSAWIECILYRAICGNWNLWGAVMDRQYRRRHVGTGAAVLTDVVRELAAVAFKWNTRTASQDEAIIRGLISAEVAKTRAGVVDELKALGFTEKDAEAAYNTCEQKENASPRSYWGLAQGATRHSQTKDYQDQRAELDRLASKLLAKGRKLVAA